MFRSGKHQALVADPVIRYKSVETLPGIDPVYGRRLRDAGFETADKVLAQYLKLNRNEQRFTSWLSSVCSVNSRFFHQCFSGLDEWYRIWGKEAYIPKIKKASSNSSLPNSLTNRMLLERKMLQYNNNSNDDPLRSLFQYQAQSLFDLSKPQRNTRDMSKSHSNISCILPYNFVPKAMENGKCQSLASLRTPSQKSVNFKENGMIEIGKPRKKELPISSKRTISPILKSRSLTPENKIPNKTTQKSAIKVLNIPNQPRASVKKSNNLNTTYNTFTKKVSNKSDEIRSIRSQSVPLEVSFKNNTNHQKGSYQNIEIYSDEEQNVDGVSRMMKAKKDNIQDYLSPWEIDDISIDLSPKEFGKKTTSPNCSIDKNQETQGKDEIASIANTNTSLDSLNESNESDDEFSWGTSIDMSLTESNENLPKAISPIPEKHETSEKVELTDGSNTPNTNNDQKKHPDKSPSFSETTCDNSNEDSGLDLNTSALVEFPNESECSDDDAKSAQYENASLSGNSTDRTFEVNETTDAESAFNFVTSSSTISNVNVQKSKVNDETGSLDLSGDEAKKTNVRLFCDMLSNDLEQIPMDKFRKLKLKILQLVYAEIDGCASK